MSGIEERSWLRVCDDCGSMTEDRGESLAPHGCTERHFARQHARLHNKLATRGNSHDLAVARGEIACALSASAVEQS